MSINRRGWDRDEPQFSKVYACASGPTTNLTLPGRGGSALQFLPATGKFDLNMSRLIE
jgi:hypothetical protein